MLDRKLCGERVDAIRMALGMTKKDFSAALSVSPSVLTRITRGERIILVDQANRLYELYGVTMDFIYLGDGDKLPKIFSDAVPRHLLNKRRR